MVKGVGGGSSSPIPQESTPVGEKESVKSSETAQSPQQSQQDSIESAKASISNATARASETAISSKILASQLQAQIAPEKPVAVAGSAVTNKPLLVKDGNNSPAEVKDMQSQLNEARARNGQELLDVDGKFGPKTEAAVKQFQEANGLKKDGIIGPNTRDRLALENNSNFQKLNPDSQKDIRDKMNAAPKDPVTRQNLLLIGTDENFGKLSPAEQKTKLLDVNGTASGIAEKKMQGMNNEQLLKLAESPGGKQQLDALQSALKSGPQTPATLKEMDRINSATFTPAGGLKFAPGSKPADQAAFLHMTRREMLTSPSLAKTMNEINADKAHPVTVNVGRDMKNVRLDVDRGGGRQDVDLADFDKLPVSPTAQNPHGITQGEVLAHAMREARERAIDPNSDHEKAHDLAIKEENKYRKDIGQTTFRKTAPDVDEDRIKNSKGDITLRIHFNGAPDEDLEFDDKQILQR